jgi:hypothetical protein
MFLMGVMPRQRETIIAIVKTFTRHFASQNTEVSSAKQYSLPVHNETNQLQYGYILLHIPTKSARSVQSPRDDMSKQPEISVILPFGQDEDHIATAVQALHKALKQSGRSFEILAIGEHSNDNSHALLRLLARDMSELRTLIAPYAGAHDMGMDEAHGRGLCFLVSPEDVLDTELSPMVDGLLEALSDSSYVEAGAFYTICCPNYALSLRRDSTLLSIPVLGRLAHLALARLGWEHNRLGWLSADSTQAEQTLC